MSRIRIVRAGACGENELPAISPRRLLPGFLEVGDFSATKGPAAILSRSCRYGLLVSETSRE